ncbi:hypothetical protein TNCV_2867731 [Trichonephila clavipes]|nr:hypothetical protein TNCV_2867731 [Trichonephila clavipes]
MAPCFRFSETKRNTLTQDFVIPTLDDILHEISGSNYFSALDMKSAFNQIPLHFADRHKTAFSTPDGDNMHQLLVHHLSEPKDDRAIVCKTPVHDFVQRLERTASPYPYSTRLQCMTSSKDWKELPPLIPTYKTPVHDFVQRLERTASPYPYSTRLQCMTSSKDWKELPPLSLQYKTPVHDFVQRLERTASPSYPYSTRLQCMTSSKDWKELPPLIPTVQDSSA